MSTNALPKGDQLLTLDQLPEWARNNPYILTGYRPISHSYRACLASWTFVPQRNYEHLLAPPSRFPAASLFLRAALVLTGKAESLTAPRMEDIVVFGVFFVGALACMGFSTAYHTLMSHSQAVADLTKHMSLSPTRGFLHTPQSLTRRVVHRYMGRVARFLGLAAGKPSLHGSVPGTDVRDVCRIRSGAIRQGTRDVWLGTHAAAGGHQVGVGARWRLRTGLGGFFGELPPTHITSAFLSGMLTRGTASMAGAYETWHVRHSRRLASAFPCCGGHRGFVAFCRLVEGV
ncbi:MAG: hypothetical protein Q9171_003569 [Xanthocarpia ochracea]